MLPFCPIDTVPPLTLRTPVTVNGSPSGSDDPARSSAGRYDQRLAIACRKGWIDNRRVVLRSDIDSDMGNRARIAVGNNDIEPGNASKIPVWRKYDRRCGNIERNSAVDSIADTDNRKRIPRRYGIVRKQRRGGDFERSIFGRGNHIGLDDQCSAETRGRKDMHSDMHSDQIGI